MEQLTINYKTKKGGNFINKLTVIVSIIGIIGTLSSIFFASRACKRTNIKEQKNDGRSEGVIVSDIGYIKACVDRVEKNLNKVDERYRIILERVAKAEEAIVSVNKRLDEL